MQVIINIKARVKVLKNTPVIKCELQNLAALILYWNLLITKHVSSYYFVTAIFVIFIIPEKNISHNKVQKLLTVK